MAYLKSERISSFPSTKRASMNKLFTENSVTRLINRLIDVEGYVITNSLKNVNFTNDVLIDAWNDSSADFEFVIRGYYFSISKGEDYLSGLEYLVKELAFDPEDQENHTLYARIFVDKTDIDYPELYGQADELGEYKAVYFYIDNADIEYPHPGDPEEYDVYDFPLVRYIEGDKGWARYVPLESLFKFNSKSISDIDGGEILI